VTLIGKDFRVDEKVMKDFVAYLEDRKLRFTDADVEENREAIERILEEEVLRQVFGEGEARRRSLAWDPQVKKALEVIPRAELLLRNPGTYVAEREREKRLADAAAASSTTRE
jgi:carboxyl-terminal processing protease